MTTIKKSTNTTTRAQQGGDVKAPATRPVDDVAPAQRPTAAAVFGGAKAPAAQPTQKEIERSPAAFAALLAHYQTPPDTKRFPFTGGVDLERDAQPTIQHRVPYSVRDNAVITDVRDLLQPDIEQRLRALGFEPEGLTSRAGRLSMTKKSIDGEMGERLGLAAFAPSGVKGPLARLADPAALGGFERVVQRVSIDYDAAGRVRDAYLLTYTWPPRGMPGMNEENIHYSAGAETRRVLINTTLDHSVAVSFGVNVHFST
jgi:hypothetical protein